jgi:hypothetical protein
VVVGEEELIVRSHDEEEPVVVAILFRTVADVVASLAELE